MRTNLKSVGNFYILFVLGVIVSLITTPLKFGVFSDPIDFGVYSLYLTFIGYLGVLSFGFQDGMFVFYRNRDIKDNISLMIKDTKFMIIFQIIVFVISLIIALIFKNSLFIYSIIAIFPMIILSNIRMNFSAHKKMNVVGVIDFLGKISVLFIMISLFLSGGSLKMYILFDIIVKFIIMFIFVFYFFKINSSTNVKIDNYKSHIVSIFKNGFLILIGNWSVIIMYGLDRIVLSDNLANLGEYSMAMTIMNLLVSVLLPTKTLILSHIDANISSLKLRYYVSVINFIAMVIVGLFSFVVVPITIEFNIFSNLHIVFKITSYLMFLIPVILNVQIILNNVMMIKHYKKYAYYNVLNLFLVFITYIVINNLFGITIGSVILSCIISYFIIYIINIVAVMKFRDYIILIAMLLGWGIGYYYSLVINNVLLYIIVTIVMIALNYKIILLKGEK